MLKSDAVIQNLKMDIVKLQAELALHRWIPVGERLPEKGNCVLTIMETGYIGKCEIVDDEWQHLGEDKVTHWKPIILPKG